MTDATPRIVGNYALGELLGRGGTSEVYAARHRFLGDPVAVKILRPELAQETAIVEAFVAEAARTRDIGHPSVVRVIDFGRDEASGSCYLVMDRIIGESLSERLQARGRLDEAELRPLCAAIADGVGAAHARGIVHRDLKPGNVMMRGDQPTIVDFGIAKSLGEGSAVVTSRRIGTLAYMAPEQLASGLITPAVDIWALGVVMFELATGQLPFERFNDGRLPQLVDKPLRAAELAPISPALSSLIARCLERDPGRRPGSMSEIARSLREPNEERVTADVGVIPATTGVVAMTTGALSTPSVAARTSSLPADDNMPTTRDLTRPREMDGEPGSRPMLLLAVILGIAVALVGGAVAIAKLASPDAAPTSSASTPALVPSDTPAPPAADPDEVPAKRVPDRASSGTQTEPKRDKKRRPGRTSEPRTSEPRKTEPKTSQGETLD